LFEMASSSLPQQPSLSRGRGAVASVLRRPQMRRPLLAASRRIGPSNSQQSARGVITA
jgi:hypothetical protein